MASRKSIINRTHNVLRSNPVLFYREVLSPKSRAGFTLIELLTAMALMVAMVMMMSRLFSDATTIWTSSTRQVNAGSEVRAVMSLLSHELSMAVADEFVNFRVSGNGSVPFLGFDSYGFPNSEVCFVALIRQSDTTYRRAANQYVYFVTPMQDALGADIPYRYRLVRTRRTRSMFRDTDERLASAYNDPRWWENHPVSDGTTEDTLFETLIENVSAFEVDVYSEHINDYTSPSAFLSGDHGNRLPVWADIYLEVLDETDAARVAALWQVDQSEATAYLMRNARRYATRVSFMNRHR